MKYWRKLTSILIAISSCQVFCVAYDEERTKELRQFLNGLDIEMSSDTWAQGIGQPVEKGANPNIAADNADGLKPLHFAAEMGNLALVKLLVERDASTDAQDNKDRTPLYFAARKGHTETISYLAYHGANVDARITGENVFWRATYNGHENAVIRLLELGAQPFLCPGISNNACAIVNAYSRFHHIPDHIRSLPLTLHNIISYGSIEELKNALAQCSDQKLVNQCDDLGLSPLDVAFINRNVDINRMTETIIILIAYGANPLVGKINGLQLTNRVKKWQTPRPSDIKRRSLFEQIYDSVRVPYLTEIFLCSPDTPWELIMLIVDWTLIPWSIYEDQALYVSHGN